MGIKIHYSGRVNHIDLVEKMSDDLEDFSRQLGWKSKRWDNDWEKPNTVKIENKDGEIRVSGHAPLKGIELFPHKNCEPFSLTFTPNGWLGSVLDLSLSTHSSFKEENLLISTKTQFAPLEIHITIIKLLEYLKKTYIQNLYVNDEGGYWKTGDIDELKRRRNTIFQAMDTLEQELTGLPAKGTENKTAEEIAEMIEQILIKPPKKDEKDGN